MKSLIAILILLVGSSSCSDKSQNLEQNVLEKGNFPSTKALEDFDSFLNKFSSDSIFQKNRIVFPIVSNLYDVDNGQIDTEVITQKDWSYSNLKSTDYTLKVYKSEKFDTVNIQGKETGVLVKYIFELIEGKWMLVKIIDEST